MTSDNPQLRDQNVPVTIRVLCLHDAKSNAKDLHKQLRLLDEKLYYKHGIEFVYINAPLVMVEEEMESADRRRIWWEILGENNFVGIDASLLHIQQIWKSNPFSGILAFGQGATLSSLLPLVESEIQFGIFVYGSALLEEDEPMMAHWPCLHVVDKGRITDVNIQKLVTQFPGQIHLAASSTITKSEWNAIGKFLVEQKKEMKISDTGEDLVLHAQLHALEQEATRVMAQAIADNPPNALMAVIHPNAQVSGWSGPKRRGFGSEGGGSPCPSEFLLKREKRSTDVGGPSRYHPKASNISEEEDQIGINDNMDE
jgi:hypothetical protein